MEVFTQYLPAILAALGAIVLLFVVMFFIKMMNKRVRGRRGQRLGISEYHEIDETRRLVLVRRDEVEHLILIGGPQDVLIESGIGLPPHPAHSGTAHHHPAASPAAPIPIRPAPRATSFAERRPAPRPVEPSLSNRQEPDLEA